MNLNKLNYIVENIVRKIEDKREFSIDELCVYAVDVKIKNQKTI